MLLIRSVRPSQYITWIYSLFALSKARSAMNINVERDLLEWSDYSPLIVLQPIQSAGFMACTLRPSGWCVHAIVTCTIKCWSQWNLCTKKKQSLWRRRLCSKAYLTLLNEEEVGGLVFILRVALCSVGGGGRSLFIGFTICVYSQINAPLILL